MDLEVVLSPSTQPDVFEVEVSSSAGHASGELRLDVDRLLGRRPELQSSVLASAVSTRRTLATTEIPIRNVGEELFSALFSGPVYGRYTASIATARARGESLRLVLHVRAAELAAIPWELLFDPEVGEYVCQREPLVRHVAVAAPVPPLSVARPLRVLGVVASPGDLAHLDVAAEQERLMAALSGSIGRGDIEVAWAGGGRWSDIQTALLDGPWHVVHFIGHGGYDDVHGEGVLALVGKNGKADIVGAERFARLLRTASPSPRLVVLNSCSSGETGADDLFSSTAASLVRSGIAAVVAMQFAVSDAAAVVFSEGFYSAIAHNRSIGEAVRIGRIAIDGISPHTLEWVTPVVYLRGEDIPLFALQSRRDVDEVRRTGRPSAENGKAEHLEALYLRALAELRVGHDDNALALFDSIVALDADYRDVVARRDELRRAQRAAEAYDNARQAESRGRYDEAVRAYEAVLAIDQGYEDAQARVDACRTRQRILDLIGEIRVHAELGDDQAVISASEELTKLDPEFEDPDGLITAAKQQVAPAFEPVPVAREARPSERRRPSIQLVSVAVAAAVLVGLGVVAVLLGGGDGQPSSPQWGDAFLTVGIREPNGVAVDDDGALYVVERNYVRRFEAGGEQRSLGRGFGGFSGDGELASEASFNMPFGIAVADHRIYIADTDNGRVRMIDNEDIITTIAGSEAGGFGGDSGPATDANLSGPYDVVVDGSGAVYIADSFNNRVRRVDADGLIATLAGTGEYESNGDGGAATEAALKRPYDVALDDSGNVFVAETDGHRIRKVDADGIITTIAGTGEIDFRGDGGLATDAVLDSPNGVAVDGSGNVFIADTHNHRIRKIDNDGIITTIAGTGEIDFSGDGGPAVDAALNLPRDIAVDGYGNVYVADWGNDRIRMITTDGMITTVVM